jgi:20S proteasome subunit beta 3
VLVLVVVDAAHTAGAVAAQVFRMTDYTYIGLPGLLTDTQTLFETLKFRVNLYRLREEREIKTSTFASLVSTLLYEHRCVDAAARSRSFASRFGGSLRRRARAERRQRKEGWSSVLSCDLCPGCVARRSFGPYFVEPVVAGLEGPDFKPYITAMDLLGAPVFTSDFVLSGTCSENLYGMCESMWRPNLEPEDLFETISQSLLAAVDRDAVSGWGAIVHVITKDKVITRTLKARQD